MVRADIIVIVQKGDKQMLEYLHEQYEGKDRLVVETVEPELGTAESLRLVKDKIKVFALATVGPVCSAIHIHLAYLQMDFVVVTCDLVALLNIQEIFDAHRLHRATMTCVCSPLIEAEMEKKGGNRGG